MFATLHALTHGAPGLAFGYSVVFVPLVAGLRRGGAPLAKLILSPLSAVPATLVAAIAVAFASPLLRPFGISKESILQLLFGTALSAAVGYAAGLWLALRKGDPDSQHRRGTVVTSEPPQRTPPPRDLSNPDCPLTLAGQTIALQDETQHFKLIGTTGTGKSTAIRELLTGALGRRDRAIIADPDGGYLDTFFDAGRGDVILNPPRYWRPPPQSGATASSRQSTSTVAAMSPAAATPSAAQTSPTVLVPPAAPASSATQPSPAAAISPAAEANLAVHKRPRKPRAPEQTPIALPLPFATNKQSLS